MLIFTIFFVLTTFICTNSTVAQVTDDESCETLQSEIHITKGITFNFSLISFICKYIYRKNKIFFSYFR